MEIENTLAVLGVIVLIVLLALGTIGVIYSMVNYICYIPKLDYGEKPSFYRIIRNGDNTISLERKELFGFWNAQELEDWGYHKTSITDNEKNMSDLKELIRKEREAIQRRIQEQERSLSDLEKHKKKPKIAHTDP